MGNFCREPTLIFDIVKYRETTAIIQKSEIVTCNQQFIVLPPKF